MDPEKFDYETMINNHVLKFSFESANLVPGEWIEYGNKNKQKEYDIINEYFTGNKFRNFSYNMMVYALAYCISTLNMYYEICFSKSYDQFYVTLDFVSATISILWITYYLIAEFTINYTCSNLIFLHYYIKKLSDILFWISNIFYVLFFVNHIVIRDSSYDYLKNILSVISYFIEMTCILLFIQVLYQISYVGLEDFHLRTKEGNVLRFINFRFIFKTAILYCITPFILLMGIFFDWELFSFTIIVFNMLICYEMYIDIINIFIYISGNWTKQFEKILVNKEVLYIIIIIGLSIFYMFKIFKVHYDFVLLMKLLIFLLITLFIYSGSFATAWLIEGLINKKDEKGKDIIQRTLEERKKNYDLFKTNKFTNKKSFNI